MRLDCANATLEAATEDRRHQDRYADARMASLVPGIWFERERLRQRLAVRGQAHGIGARRDWRRTATAAASSAGAAPAAAAATAGGDPA